MSFSFRPLLEIIHDVWNGQYDLDVFRRRLRDYKAAIMNPINATKRSRDRDEIQSKSVTIDNITCKIDEHYSKMVLEFSDAVNLNEKESLRFFIKAREELKSEVRLGQEVTPSMVKERAVENYFRRRHSLLLALLDLVYMYESEDLDRELVTVVNEYVHELVRDDFVSNLAKLLRDLLGRTTNPYDSRSAASPGDLRQQHETEAWLVVQIIFRLYRRVVPDLDTLRQLVGELKFCSGLLYDHGQNASLLLCVYTLLCTFFAALERRFQYESSRSILSEEVDAFTRAIDGEMRGGWQNDHFQNAANLAWEVYLLRMRALSPQIRERGSEALAKAFDHGVFPGLYFNFLNSARFHHEPATTRLIISEVLGEFFTSVVQQYLPTLRARKWAFLADEQPPVDAYEVQSHYFLACISTVAGFAPSCVELFLNSHEFRELFEELSQQVSFQSELLPFFVDLVEALCSGDSPHAPEYIHEVLKRAADVQWDKLFANLSWYRRHYAPSQESFSRDAHAHHASPYSLYGPGAGAGPLGDYQGGRAAGQSPQMPARITDEYVRMMICMLRLVQAVTKSPEIQNLMGKHSENNRIEELFALLGCVFPPNLKAQILNTICSLVKGNTRFADEAWERLEASQILPTFLMESAANQLGKPPGVQGRAAGASSVVRQGIVYDLEEVEKRDGEYPLTIAFTELVLELLYATPVPEALGNAYRRPGIHPYLSFIIDHVLLQLDHREYRNSSERWKLAEVCLSICCRLLDSFSPELAQYTDEPISVQGRTVMSPRAPGFELLRQLCSSERNDLFVKILSVLVHAQRYLEQEEIRHSGGHGADRQGKPKDGDDASDDKAKDDAQQQPSLPTQARTERDSVESSLMLALKLIASAVDKEDVFIRNLLAKHPDATVNPVSSMLLMHTREVVAISRAIEHVPEQAYSPEESITAQLSYYASCILMRLAKRDGGLLVNIFNSMRCARAIVHAFAMQFRHIQPSREAAGSAPGADVVMSDATAADPAQDGSDGDWGNRARLILMQILLGNLDTPDSSLALMLLGFRVGSDNVSGDVTAQLHEDEAMRECLLQLVALASKVRFAQHSPELAEATFELFYKLCLHPATSPAFLKHLQLHHDLFFLSLLKALDNAGPALAPAPASAGGRSPASAGDLERMSTYLLQRAWLLKATALELHLTTQRAAHWNDFVPNALACLGFTEPDPDSSSQTVASAALSSAPGPAGASRRVPSVFGAVSDSSFAARPGAASSSMMLDGSFSASGYSRIYESRQDMSSVSLLGGPNEFGGGFGALDSDGRGSANRSRAYSELSFLLSTLNVLAAVSRRLPDVTPLAEVEHGIEMAHFRVRDSPDSFVYNVRVLYDYARTRLGDAHALRLCERASLCNLNSKVLVAAKQAFDGWRQTVEVAVYECFNPQEWPARYESVLFELISALLRHLQGAHEPSESSQLWAILSDSITAASLTLMAKVRENVAIVSSSNGGAADRDADGISRAAGDVLQLLVDAIQHHKYHSSRAHLYAVFLNYVQYTSELLAPSPSLGMAIGGSSLSEVTARAVRMDPELSALYNGHDTSWRTPAADRSTHDSFASTHRGGGFAALDFSTSAAHERKREDVALRASQRTEMVKRMSAVLRAAGPKLLDLVVRDTAEGNPQLRSMSFVFLNTLVSLDDQLQVTNVKGSWLACLRDSGAVNQFLSQLRRSETLLHDAVTAATSSPHQVFHYQNILQYESLMALLVRMAETGFGAEVLLDSGAFTVLCHNARYLGTRPVGGRGSAAASDGGYDSSAGAAAAAAMSSADSVAHMFGLGLSPTERYLQLLNPALRLVVTLLTSLKGNEHAHKYALQFMGIGHGDQAGLPGQHGTRPGHREAIVGLLRDTPLDLSTDALSLQAVQLITSAFYALYVGPLSRAEPQPDFIMRERHQQQPYAQSPAALLYELTKSFRPLFLRLLASYSSLDTHSHHVRALLHSSSSSSAAAAAPALGSISTYGYGYGDQAPDAGFRSSAPDAAAAAAAAAQSSDPAVHPRRLADEICKNVLAICRAYLPMVPSPERLLFAPHIQALAGVDNGNHLSVLVVVAERVAKQMTDALDEHRKSRAALDKFNTVSMDELCRRMRIAAPASFSESQKRVLAFRELTRRLTVTLRDVHAFVFILEHALQVLYHHMSWYFRDEANLHEDPQHFKRKCSDAVRPLLADAVEPAVSRLDSLKSQRKPSHRFIGAMVRKFKRKLAGV